MDRIQHRNSPLEVSKTLGKHYGCICQMYVGFSIQVASSNLVKCILLRRMVVTIEEK